MGRHHPPFGIIKISIPNEGWLLPLTLARITGVGDRELVVYRLGYGRDDRGRSRCDGTERIAIASYVSLANPKPTRPRRCRSPNSWPSWVSRRAMRIALAAILARNLGVPSARLGPVPVTMSAHSPVSDATGSPILRADRTVELDPRRGAELPVLQVAATCSFSECAITIVASRSMTARPPSPRGAA